MIQIEGSLYQICKLSSSASYHITDCEPNILAFYNFFYSYLCEFHFVLRAIDNSLARVKLFLIIGRRHHNIIGHYGYMEILAKS